jgi:hypothetical protein
MRTKVKRILGLLVLVIMCYQTGYAQMNVFPDSSKVGIGTTSPVDKLHIHVENNNGILLSGRKSGNSSSLGYLQWRNEYASIGTPAAEILVETPSSIGSPWNYTDMIFKTANGYNMMAEKMRITHSGNVGIGTSNPAVNLHIRGTGNTTTIRLHSKDGGTKSLDLSWDNINSVAFLRANGSYSLCLQPVSGNVGIGTYDPTAKLAVNGTTKTKELIVTDQSSDWPDYVFEGTSDRSMNLKKLEAYINAHKHLPGIPTENDISEYGQNLANIQKKLLKKIEELTLYVIKQNNKIQRQQNEINELKMNQNSNGAMR